MKGVYKPGVVVLMLLAITTTASAFTEIGDNITVVNNVTAQNFLGYLNWAYLLGIPIDFPNSTVASYSGNFPNSTLAGYGNNFPNSTLAGYGGNFPNTSLPNYLLISTYNGDFPNSTLPNYLLISTYGGNFPNNTLAGYNNNFPNSTLAGYGGNFPNTSLPNYLLISTYNGDFPNSTLPNYLLISTYGGNFPNSTLAGYGNNFPNSTLAGYGNNFPNTSLPNYLLISTYGGNFPNNTLAGYNNNFPNSTLAGYGNNFPNTSLPNYLLISTYGGNFPNTSLPNYLLISTYSGNFPNSTLAGYGNNFPNSTLAGYGGNFPNNTLAGYNNNFPNTTLAGYGGNFPNTSLPNYLLISTYSGDFPNSTLPNYLLISTYGGNFPNSTLAGYGGNFPNTSLPNYLLISTYNGDFPNSTVLTKTTLAQVNSSAQIGESQVTGLTTDLSNKESAITGSTNNVFWNGLKQWIGLTSSNISDFTAASRSSMSAGSNLTYSSSTGVINDVRTDYPNSTLATYNGNFPNTSLPNYLLISTYGTNFPNSTLAGYGGNFPNNTVASKEAAWDAKTNFSLNVSGQPQIYNSASLTAGTNITLTQTGNSIEISSTGIGVAVHDLNGTSHTGTLNYSRINGVLVNLVNNVTGLLQDANIASASLWNSLQGKIDSVNSTKANKTDISEFTGGLLPDARIQNTSVWNNKTTLAEVNASAQINRSQVIGQESVDTGQNNSIATKTTLTEVNASAQISRSQVTGQMGLDDSQNTSINSKTDFMYIPMFTTQTSATTKTNAPDTVSVANLGITAVGMGSAAVVNMTGFTTIRLIMRGANSGTQTGTVTVVVRDLTNAANLVSLSYSDNTVQFREATAAVAITGLIKIQVLASSTVSTDDPLFGDIGVMLEK